ncbi:hypothetical protein DL93DRAFT_998842 [Clavulina sp. PMI_390]|nr:hypothetical protein DL93DRAFT_998842 [Clavulina sp. PMI_390]
MHQTRISNVLANHFIYARDEDDDEDAEEITSSYLEIFTLSWLSETAPQFRFVTMYEHASSEEDPGQVDRCQLDGDIVCVMLDSQSIYFWHWRKYQRFDHIYQIDTVSAVTSVLLSVFRS